MTHPNAYDFTEADILKRAREHPCPACGAKAGVRCRILTPNTTATGRTKVDVKRKPCPERATLTWRKIRDEIAGEPS